jgi:hypothetical protein
MAEIRDIQSLGDVPGFAPLVDLGREIGVSVTLRGSFVRRLVTRPELLEKGEACLLEYAPFLSDVDLSHDGGMAESQRLIEGIRSRIPHADLMRWEIRSPSGNQFQESWRFNAAMPWSGLRLDEDGFGGPELGFEQLRNGQLTYRRNRRYRQSPAYQAGRDLEVFGALLFLGGLIEAMADGNETVTDARSLEQVNAVLLETFAEESDRLQNDRILRGRMHYKLRRLRSTRGFGLLEGHFRQALDRLAELSGESATEDAAYVTTSQVESGEFRLPSTQSYDTADLDPEAFGLDIPSGLRLIASTAPMPITPGVTPSTLGGSEFAHVQFPDYPIDSIPEPEDLTALLTFSAPDGPPVALPLPSAVWKAGQEIDDSLLLRVNALGSLQAMGELGDGIQARFLVVAREEAPNA